MSHHLLIPVSGPIELIHASASARSLLEERSEGVYVEFGLNIDDEPNGMLSMLVGNETVERNPRAQEALVWIGGVHMVMHGNVIFTDVPAELVTELARDIG